jgi:serine protein kinase
MYNDSLFNAFVRSFEARSQSDMSMAEYLDSCRSDPMKYANAAERLLAAIGEPQMIDTAKDPRLGRIFLNRTMRTYPAFSGFHGMEETIERIVGFFRHAAQGLEERKQILYLLGPVGGGKSSLAERLKSLMEVHPIYVLKAADELSPVFESPLSLFNPEQLGPIIEDKYGIPRRRLIGLMSPWCYKRLEAFGGDISQCRVVRIQPSRLRQIGPPRPNRAMRTIRTSPRWSGRSISASLRPTPRTIPTPIATREFSTAPIRAFSNSSRSAWDCRPGARSRSPAAACSPMCSDAAS